MFYFCDRTDLRVKSRLNALRMKSKSRRFERRLKAIEVERV